MTTTNSTSENPRQRALQPRVVQLIAPERDDSTLTVDHEGLRHSACAEAPHEVAAHVPDYRIVDVLAAYVAPYDAWYLIPFSELEGRWNFHLFTHRPESQGMFEKYRDRWDLLE